MAPTISSGTGGELIDKSKHVVDGQVLVKVFMIELEHRGRPARGETFHRAQREFTVGSGPTGLDPEVLADTVDDFVGAAQAAREVGADFEVKSSHRLAVEHRVEGHHAVDVRHWQFHQSRYVLLDLRTDPAELALGYPKHGDQGRLAGRVASQ